MTEHSYVYTTYIHVTPERLWEALTTPSFTRRYFDFMEGFMAVESNWAPGAPVVYRTDDEQAQIEGRVLTIEAPTRLVTSLSLRYDAEVRQDRPSRLSWEITQMDEVCRLTVVHDDIDSETKTAREVAICMPSILSNLRVLLETGRPRLIKEIVVDCASPERLATFWAAATGYVRQGEGESFIALADPQGVGPELAFAQVPEPKIVKNRVHVDLHVLDLDAAIERLVALGGQRAPNYPQSETHAVMIDPEGNEFCIFS